MAVRAYPHASQGGGLRAGMPTCVTRPTGVDHLSPGQLPENQACPDYRKDYRDLPARLAGWRPLALGRAIVTPRCDRENDRQHNEEHPDDNRNVHDLDRCSTTSPLMTLSSHGKRRLAGQLAQRQFHILVRLQPGL